MWSLDTGCCLVHVFINLKADPIFKKKIMVGIFHCIFQHLFSVIDVLSTPNCRLSVPLMYSLASAARN